MVTRGQFSFSTCQQRQQNTSTASVRVSTTGAPIRPPLHQEAHHLKAHPPQGLHYLHTHAGGRIVHFDVKPGNLLLRSERGASLVCKIADFGLSRALLHTRVTAPTGGSLPYIAPELFTRVDKATEKVHKGEGVLVVWALLYQGQQPCLSSAQSVHAVDEGNKKVCTMAGGIL